MHTLRSQASVSAFKGDTAVRLLINFTDGGNAYIIADGCTAVLSGTKADGTKLYNRCVILNNTTVQYDFTEQTTNWAGVINCEVIIYGADGKEITAPKFIIVVDERETVTEEIISEDERTAIGIIFDQENKRNLAEVARAEAETARAEAEEARKEAEALRKVAEIAREEAENGKVDSEGNVLIVGRVNAEEARATAELERIEAEKIRSATYTEIRDLAIEIRGEVENVMDTLIEINEGGIEA
jgi:hypothetical protein